MRKLCVGCRTTRPATAEQQEELLNDYFQAFGKEPPITRESVLAGWMARNSRDGRLMLHASPGCKECGNTGYKGRAACTN